MDTWQAEKAKNSIRTLSRYSNSYTFKTTALVPSNKILIDN